MIAIQNPGILAKGALEIVDAYYDERSGYNGTPASFSIAGYGGALPITIQNMPEEQFGAVYGSGDGSFSPGRLCRRKDHGTVSGLNGLSSSIFITRNRAIRFRRQSDAHVFTVVNQAERLDPRLSAFPTSIASASIRADQSRSPLSQNSNYAYYPRQLTARRSLAYSGGPTTWPKAAVDCEPQNAPTWCLFQMQSPDHIDATGNYYGAPLTFDRPVKAVFSADGSTAYILNCGPECGGSTASISIVPVAPMIFLTGPAVRLAPCNLPANGSAPTPALRQWQIFPFPAERATP